MSSSNPQNPPTSAAASSASKPPSEVLTVLHLFEYRIKTMVPIEDFDSQKFAKSISKFLQIPEDFPIALFRYSKTAGSYTYLDTPESYATLKRTLKVKGRIQILVTPLRKYVVSDHIKELAQPSSKSKTESSTGAAADLASSGVESAQPAESTESSAKEPKAKDSSKDSPRVSKTSGKELVASISKSLSSSSSFISLIAAEVKALEEKNQPESTTSPQCRNSNNSQTEKEDLPAKKPLPRHSAYCDDCDASIFGNRYKCFDCPDFDLCERCFASNSSHSSMHNFIRISEPDNYIRCSMMSPATKHTFSTHIDVMCDGPMCEGRSNCITGVRYKCLVCDDYDLCGNCESSPFNKHDYTHPMIKIKTSPYHRPHFTSFTRSCPFTAKKSESSQPRVFQQHFGGLFHALSKIETDHLKKKAKTNSEADPVSKANNEPSTETPDLSETTTEESSPAPEVEKPDFEMAFEEKKPEINYTASIDSVFDTGNKVNGKKCFFVWIKNTTSQDILSTTDTLKSPDHKASFLPCGTKLVVPSNPDVVSFESTCEVPPDNAFSFVVHMPVSCDASKLDWYLQLPGQSNVGNKIDSDSIKVTHIEQKWTNKSIEEDDDSASEPKVESKSSSVSQSVRSSQIILPKLPCESPSSSMVTATETPAATFSTLQVSQHSSAVSLARSTASFETAGNDCAQPHLFTDTEIPGSPILTSSTVDYDYEEDADENDSEFLSDYDLISEVDY